VEIAGSSPVRIVQIKLVGQLAKWLRALDVGIKKPYISTNEINQTNASLHL
jgi:hypothetical protein